MIPEGKRVDNGRILKKCSIIDDYQRNIDDWGISDR